ncbi:hypothetical protein P3T76_013898 [Phytophthora citrophthora]|uniref:CCHC-type domain-containing protein n=1 Tax=Phytophthora citrophthora TaxID=4793 RepID=A0AAD9LBR2_9STRA|nr:hypothetical protein P3T76_013898 [Phytophthora citrophthora]
MEASILSGRQDDRQSSEHQDSKHQGFRNPNYNSRYCENCRSFGHVKEDCWADIECERYHRKGHPVRFCRMRQCDFCNKYHDGHCEELKALRDLKNLVRQGLWVANIGEGVDVLLGIDFMYSAGVRLCVREGLVQLPDKENVMLSGRTFDQQKKDLRL